MCRSTADGTAAARVSRQGIHRQTDGRGQSQAPKSHDGHSGLGDAVGWGDDVDKVIGDGDDDDNTQDTQSNGQQKNGAAELPPKDIFEGLSARQIAMSREKGQHGGRGEQVSSLRW